MPKLLDCPMCDRTQVPVQNSAEVCSTKCRVRKLRAKRKERNKAIEAAAALRANLNSQCAEDTRDLCDVYMLKMPEEE